ncbi:hypothetical protein [Nonomuraea sp. JJY05]|uniref:hypothetical protein n=1 Tax=Nonomuraea sp. JJY05 TaxID=3350255 RepID=UPI00373F2BA6
MSRHLAPLHLAQLGGTPAPPPPGHVAVYAAQDGTLHQQTSDGAAAPVTASRVARTSADIIVTPNQPSAPLPGLQLDLVPGLQRVSAFLPLQAVGGRVATDVSLAGPGASLIFATSQLIYATQGSHYVHATNAYGPILDGSYWIYPAGLIHLKLDAVVDAVEPGTVALVSTVHRERYVYDMTPEQDLNDWNGADAAINPIEAPARSPGGSMHVLAYGDADAVAWQTGDVNGGRWRFEAWLYSDTGWAQAGLRMTWWNWEDANTQVGENSDIRPLPAGQWTRFALEVEQPATATDVRLNIGLWGAVPADTVFYIDDVVFEEITGQLKVPAGSLMVASPL